MNLFRSHLPKIVKIKTAVPILKSNILIYWLSYVIWTLS